MSSYFFIIFLCDFRLLGGLAQLLYALLSTAALVAAANGAAQRQPHEAYSADQLRQQAELQQRQQQHQDVFSAADRQQRQLGDRSPQGFLGSGAFPGTGVAAGAGGIPLSSAIDAASSRQQQQPAQQSDRRQALYYDPYSGNPPPPPPLSGPADGGYPVYDFGYSVSDPNAQLHQTRQETRDGDRVTGSYSYVDPNGSLMRVTYEADALNGYRARVETVQPPLASPVVPRFPLRGLRRLNRHDARRDDAQLSSDRRNYH
ncbi:unnamed protein product, partial [Notodromas monacha]